LGISKRISWWWMWVLPCGYCYILQAGSVGNDAIAAVYLLASFHYLFQTKGRSLSILAIALTTGVKASNLPLLLPWLVTFFFRRHFLFEKGRLASLGAVLIFASFASFLPNALLNIHFTGDFAGDPLNTKGMKLSNPISGMLGNSLEFAVINLEPPIFPWELDGFRLLPSTVKADLEKDFPTIDLHTGQMQFEEMAGLGLGGVLFLSLFVVVGIKARVSASRLTVDRPLERVIMSIAVAIALAFYMAKIGSPAASRLIASYYPLIIAAILLLVSLDGRAMQAAAFNWVGLIAMLSALPLIILSPARPLFPVQIVSRLITRSHLPSYAVNRFLEVYSIYGARADSYHELTALIPPDQHTIGFLASGDTPEAPLWRPFDKRTVVDLKPDASLLEVRRQNISYVVVSDVTLVLIYHTTISQLLSHWSGTLLAQKVITLKSHTGPETFYLLKL
jgi:hypothetical protein